MKLPEYFAKESVPSTSEQPNIPASAYGADVFKALGEVGEKAFNLVAMAENQKADAQRATVIADSTSAALANYTEFGIEISKHPDSTTHVENWDKWAKDYNEAAVKDIQDPYVKKDMIGKLGQLRESAIVKARHEARTMAVEEYGKSVDVLMDTASRAAYASGMDPDHVTEALGTINRVYDSLSQGGMMAPDKAEEARKKHISRFFEKGVMSLAEKDASSADEYLREHIYSGKVDSKVRPVEPGNIDLSNRPIVHNEDGSISTVRSMSFEEGGREVLIPTVAEDGSRILSDKEAIQQYKDTGHHLGKFDTPKDATSYAKSLHKQQEAMYGGEPDLRGILEPDALVRLENHITVMETKQSTLRDREFNRRSGYLTNQLRIAIHSGKLNRGTVETDIVGAGMLSPGDEEKVMEAVTKYEKEGGTGEDSDKRRLGHWKEAVEMARIRRDSKSLHQYVNDIEGDDTIKSNDRASLLSTIAGVLDKNRTEAREDANREDKKPQGYAEAMKVLDMYYGYSPFTGGYMKPDNRFPHFDAMKKIENAAYGIKTDDKTGREQRVAPITGYSLIQYAHTITENLKKEKEAKKKDRQRGTTGPVKPFDMPYDASTRSQ